MEKKNINEEVRYSITDENCRVIEVACYNQEYICGGPIIELSDNKTAFEFNANNLDCVIEVLLKLRQRLTPFMDAESFEKNKALLRANGMGAWCDLFEKYHSKAASNKVGGHDSASAAMSNEQYLKEEEEEDASERETLEENEKGECPEDGCFPKDEYLNEHEDLFNKGME